MLECKVCGNYEVLTSRARGLELPLWFVLMRPYRCTRCNRRQYQSIFRHVMRSVHRVNVCQQEMDWDESSDLLLHKFGKSLGSGSSLQPKKNPSSNLSGWQSHEAQNGCEQTSQHETIAKNNSNYERMAS